jgi:hypothetical protein
MAGLARLFKARGGMLRFDEESILEPGSRLIFDSSMLT